MRRALPILAIVLIVGGLAIAAHLVDWPGIFRAINPHR
jgi:hypothetical protein